jgi:hypothetical protein
MRPMDRTKVYSKVVSNDAHAATQSNVMDRNGARGLDEHQAAILAACQCQAYRSTRQLLIPSPSSSPSQRETFLPTCFRYAQPCFASHAPAPSFVKPPKLRSSPDLTSITVACAVSCFHNTRYTATTPSLNRRHAASLCASPCASAVSHRRCRFRHRSHTSRRLHTEI